MMFSQSLFQDPASARAATQQFMTFLELEAEKGQMSRSIEKKVLGKFTSFVDNLIYFNYCRFHQSYMF